MAKKKDGFAQHLRTNLLRLCRLHFVFVALYAIYTIAADGTHLITPTLVFERWIMNAILFVGVSLIWYGAWGRLRDSGYYRRLIYALILLDIMMATFNIYTQRGMAARAVMLFSIPIVISAVLSSRTALFATAALSTAAYSLAAIKYFVDYFNEGYKAELYIEVGFYCGVFFILVAVLSIVVRSRQSD
ncbi:MAG TPA: hypothetical protein VLE74_02505 [Candidatus Saccharimonadales bacterium]|nr:hypothetical protein [Candidatus Saccharimonadales bacterium]